MAVTFQTIFGNLGEAMCNPDKSTGPPPFMYYMPFQIQGPTGPLNQPNITRVLLRLIGVIAAFLSRATPQG